MKFPGFRLDTNPYFPEKRRSLRSARSFAFFAWLRVDFDNSRNIYLSDCQIAKAQ